MAYKSVVADDFSDSLAEALKSVESGRGNFVRAMSTPSFPEIRKWNLQVSAEWLDAFPSSHDGAEDLQRLLQAEPGPIVQKIGFVQVRRSDSLLVQTLVPVFDVPQISTAYTFSSLEQTMFNFDEVIVLVARPALLAHADLRLSA